MTKTNRQSGWNSLVRGLQGLLQSIIAVFWRGPADERGTVSTKPQDDNVIHATRRRPTGSSNPDERPTAKPPKRRR